MAAIEVAPLYTGEVFAKLTAVSHDQSSHPAVSPSLYTGSSAALDTLPSKRESAVSINMMVKIRAMLLFMGKRHNDDSFLKRYLMGYVMTRGGCHAVI